MKWRRLSSGNYFGRSSKYYAFIYKREHGKFDGFDKYQFWYTARIGSAGKWLWGEGMFGSYLNTIKKAKTWCENKISNSEKLKL